MKTKPWNETIVIGDFSYADREIDNLICQVSRPVQNDWGFRKFLPCLRSEDILSSVIGHRSQRLPEDPSSKNIQ